MRFGYAKSATALGMQCHWRLLSMSDQGAVKWGRGPAGRSGIPVRRARDGGRTKCWRAIARCRMRHAPLPPVRHHTMPVEGGIHIISSLDFRQRPMPLVSWCWHQGLWIPTYWQQAPTIADIPSSESRSKSCCPFTNVIGVFFRERCPSCGHAGIARRRYPAHPPSQDSATGPSIAGPSGRYLLRLPAARSPPDLVVAARTPQYSS